MAVLGRTYFLDVTKAFDDVQYSSEREKPKLRKNGDKNHVIFYLLLNVFWIIPEHKKCATQNFILCHTE